MYRINDRSAAIESVQRYLRVAGNPDVFVAPTGVFDDNTKLSVIDFQQKNGLDADGVVDKNTFDLLFAAFTFLSERDRIRYSDARHHGVSPRLHEQGGNPARLLCTRGDQPRECDLYG